MTEQEKLALIAQSWQIHDQIEQHYLLNDAQEGEDAWPEKQRLLLADMALHLLQTSLAPDPLVTQKLTNNIYSILTVADLYLPQSKLKIVAEALYQSKE